MIKTEKNTIVQTGLGHQLLADAFYPENSKNLPVIIFAHGYKGYKDWGAFNILAEYFAGQGFLFVKFNFSHNGTILENPTEFENLEAFGHNNFSIELDDYRSVTDFFLKHPAASDRIFLMGHSRGGGISVIEAFEDRRILGLALLAGVSHFGYRFPHGERLVQWEEERVFYSENKRTKQQMPHYYQFYEDYKKNEDRFNIQYAVQHFERPMIIIQGTEDEAVKEKEAGLLHEWAKKSELVMIEGAGHTFGASEPWENPDLPEHLQIAAEKISGFFKKVLSENPEGFSADE